MATSFTYDVGTDYITVYARTSHSDAECTIYLRLATSQNADEYDFSGSSGSNTFYYDGDGDAIQPKTRYVVNVRAVYTTGEGESEQEVTEWAGAQTITTEADRPDYFSWDTSKVSGAIFNVTASEWRGLLENINDVLEYSGKSRQTFKRPSSGDTFLASIFNEARNAIATMSTRGLPSTKSKGDTIYASDLNNLVDTLNSIE